MLCSELFEIRRPLFEGEQIDVCGTTAIINPWPSDVAKMLTQSSTLRALSEPGRFVIWPANEALHQPVQIALNMDQRARRYLVYSSIQPNERATVRVGRFFVWMISSAHENINPKSLGQQVRVAFGLR